MSMLQEADLHGIRSKGGISVKYVRKVALVRRAIVHRHSSFHDPLNHSSSF